MCLMSLQEAVAVGDDETAHGSEHEERHHVRRAGTYPSHVAVSSLISELSARHAPRG